MNPTKHHTQQDFRLFLQSLLVEKCQANPRYSLRSFARHLHVDASTLSQILRGRRVLTAARVYELGTRLGLSPTEVAAFAEKTSTKKKRKAIVDPVLNSSASRSAHELSLDAFQLIADWYHYAIFEMVTMKDFVPKPRWIAKALGISVNEVHLALERLERLELIRIDETGNFQQGQPLITTTGNPFTAVAFRKLQTHVLQMALSALEEVPMEARDQTSMTMAINSKKLPEAKERIKQFRRQLCDFLQEDTDERDSVYQLGVSLYPLTKMHLQDLKTNERKEARK